MNAVPIEVRHTTSSDGARRTWFEGAGAVLGQRDVLGRLEREPAFRALFVAQLAQAPCEAFFWETPAWRQDDPARPYEHVLRAAPELVGIAADARPFHEHLAGRVGVVAFGNLGGDAELVVPAREARLDAYPHLAAFVRLAPPEQVDALFERVARALRARLAALAPARTWLSTSGLGVPWVHVRLDAAPKYYTHAPYRR